jgi:uncharacterized membrane protein
MQDKQRAWSFFAHSSIITGMVFIVMFVIDRFSPALELLASNFSGWLILILAALAVVNGFYSAIFLFQKQKRRDEKRNHAIGRPAREREI